jgi:nitrogen fixation protein NifX
MSGLNAISRDVALRIGLAARVLPGVGVPRLLDVLREKSGTPLTIESLTKITVTDLKTGLGSLDGEEDSEEMNISMEEFKLAVRYLWGEEDVTPDLPVIQAYEEGEMPGSIRVALASNTADDLNGHFGSCPRFLVYQVSSEEIRLVAIRSTAGADESDDRNAFRANVITDCHVLYVQSVGGPAAAKVVRAGIYPLKIPEGGKALEILEQLQTVMAGSPPPWLAKILGVPAEQRTKYKAEAAG